jgi:hypothetical protein
MNGKPEWTKSSSLLIIGAIDINTNQSMLIQKNRSGLKKGMIK